MELCGHGPLQTSPGWAGRVSSYPSTSAYELLFLGFGEVYDPVSLKQQNISFSKEPPGGCLELMGEFLLAARWTNGEQIAWKAK